MLVRRLTFLVLLVLLVAALLTPLAVANSQEDDLDRDRFVLMQVFDNALIYDVTRILRSPTPGDIVPYSVAMRDDYTLFTLDYLESEGHCVAGPLTCSALMAHLRYWDSLFAYLSGEGSRTVEQARFRSYNVMMDSWGDALGYTQEDRYLMWPGPPFAPDPRPHLRAFDIAPTA